MDRRAGRNVHFVRGLWLGLGFTVGLCGLFALTAAPAQADGIAGEMASFAVKAIPLLLALIVATWFLEAAILNRFLQRRYWRMFAIAVLINIVSTELGLRFWPHIFRATLPGTGEQIPSGFAFGWKWASLLAFEEHRYGPLAVLFLRSFLITVVEETLLVMLLLRKQFAKIAVATVAANSASYILALLVMYLIFRIG